MNILIDLRPLMGGKTSGVEVYTRNIVEKLLQKETEDTYILWVNAWRRLNVFEPLEKNNSRVREVHTKIPNKILNLSLKLFKWPKIDSLISKSLDGLPIDIVLMPDLRPSTFSKKVKKVMVIHDISFHHFPRFFSWKSRLWYRLLNPKDELFSSDAIIAVSHATKKDVVKTYHIPPEKIQVIHEAVDDDFGKELSEKRWQEIQRKYQLPDQYFLFLATIEPRKNMGKIIEAFLMFQSRNKEKKIHLVLAGQRNKKIFSTFELATSPHIHFPGFIDDKDKAEVMAHASAFLYPSLFEGFGLPLLEAMKCNTPIITSKTSSMPEVCGDAARYVDPGNASQIEEAMEEILKPEIRKKLSECGKQQIKKFRWDKCADETYRLLISVFQCNPSRK